MKQSSCKYVYTFRQLKIYKVEGWYSIAIVLNWSEMEKNTLSKQDWFNFITDRKGGVRQSAPLPPPPRYWHILAAIAAVGTHPIGMHFSIVFQHSTLKFY